MPYHYSQLGVEVLEWYLHMYIYTGNLGSYMGIHIMKPGSRTSTYVFQGGVRGAPRLYTRGLCLWGYTLWGALDCGGWLMWGLEFGEGMHCGEPIHIYNICIGGGACAEWQPCGSL